MVKILDGKVVACKILEEVKKEVFILKKKNIFPSLAVILVDKNPASVVFIQRKKEACRELGINFRLYQFDQNVTEDKIISLISNLNAQIPTHGIIVQLPLPSGFSRERILEAINPKKDVDGFHPKNKFTPAVALAVLEILKFYKIRIKNKRVVVLGKGRYVGLPIGNLLKKNGGTVISLGQETKNIKDYTLLADILVSATGQPRLVKKEMVQKGAVVIDVGTTFVGGKLVGDCDFENVKKIAGYISPVPGGIGPLTVAKLLENTIEATKLLTKIKI